MWPDGTPLISVTMNLGAIMVTGDGTQTLYNKPMLMDITQTHIEQLPNGRWGIINPDLTRFCSQTYKTRGSVTRARNEYLRNFWCL